MRYIDSFLSKADSQGLLDWCVNPAKVAWRQEQFSIYGRSVQAPRHLAWFGEAGINYRYTGLDHLSAGWPPVLKDLSRRINAEHGLDTNFVLLNRYDHGQHYMGWHRDDEAAAEPTIASLSLGGTRRFRHRRASHGPSEMLELECGSLLVFDGRMQHTLPKTVRPVGLRINLTFRKVHALPETNGAARI